MFVFKKKREAAKSAKGNERTNANEETKDDFSLPKMNGKNIDKGLVELEAGKKRHQPASVASFNRTIFEFIEHVLIIGCPFRLFIFILIPNRRILY